MAENEACPEGFYLEVISRHSAEKDLNNLKLEGKAACKKCHPLCKKCTGFGFHKEVCDVCLNYIQNDQCVQKCSDGYYINKVNNTCLPCHSGNTYYDYIHNRVIVILRVVSRFVKGFENGV